VVEEMALDLKYMLQVLRVAAILAHPELIPLLANPPDKLITINASRELVEVMAEELMLEALWWC
jgi:hypothetical protein